MSRDESFIPWEQIQPLLYEGITGLQFAEAVIARLGLPQDRYTVLGDREYDGEPLSDVIRRGVKVVPVKQAARLRKSCGADEVLA